LVLYVVVRIETSKFTSPARGMCRFDVEMEERAWMMLRGIVLVRMQKRGFGEACQYRQAQKDGKGTPHCTSAYITNRGPESLAECGQRAVEGCTRSERSGGRFKSKLRRRGFRVRCAYSRPQGSYERTHWNYERSGEPERREGTNASAAGEAVRFWYKNYRRGENGWAVAAETERTAARVTTCSRLRVVPQCGLRWIR
jgi:hypothetical protein